MASCWSSDGKGGDPEEMGIALVEEELEAVGAVAVGARLRIGWWWP